MRRIRVHCCRKETEDDDNSTVTDRPSVKHDPPDARDMKGSPHKLVGFPVGSAHLARFSNIATDAAPEQESLCDGVGRIEGGNSDGKDDVECRGGAQIDDANEAGYTGHDIDGVERDSGLGVHLFVDENQQSPLRSNLPTGPDYQEQEGEKDRLAKQRTVDICLQKGRPLSRPKAKTMRDAVARKAMTAKTNMAMTMLIMTVAPEYEPTESRTTCIKGKPSLPVGLSRTAVMSTVT